MKLADRIRAALNGGMYSTVQGKGVEAMILVDGVCKGVVFVSPAIRQEER